MLMTLKREYGYLTLSEKKTLYYVTVGEGYPTIFLPGWSSNLRHMPLEIIFSDHEELLCCNKFYFFHLSNFSESTFTDMPYSLNDYASEINAILDNLEIEKANFIGHSAGGRIVLYYTAYNQNRVRKLALLNAAGLKHPDATDRMVGKAKHYFTKYNSVSDPEEKILRETFKNLYNAHITDHLPLIKNPILIIWGKLDKTINVSRAYTFKKHLPHAELVIYDDLGHDTLSDSRVVDKLLRFINDI